MNIDLRSAFLNLENSFSLTDIILPFILIFAIIYAVSAKVLHFEGKGKKFQIVVSFVLSLMAVIPHVTGAYGQFDVINIINNSIPQVIMIIIGVILALMLIGATGIDSGFGADDKFKQWAKYIALAIVGLIIWTNVDSSGSFRNIPFLGMLADPDIQAIALILIVFGGLVAYITGENDEYVCKCNYKTNSESKFNKHLADNPDRAQHVREL
ncbi:hypothetical protein KY334_02910 [Candidatus Woesearchaeota archaeon]|nr:hypothetical protein [Candidatus Woesearchaeota archaeon]